MQEEVKKTGTDVKKRQTNEYLTFEEEMADTTCGCLPTKNKVPVRYNREDWINKKQIKFEHIPKEEQNLYVNRERFHDEVLEMKRSLDEMLATIRDVENTLKNFKEEKEVYEKKQMAYDVYGVDARDLFKCLLAHNPDFRRKLAACAMGKKNFFDFEIRNLNSIEELTGRNRIYGNTIYDENIDGVVINGEYIQKGKDGKIDVSTLKTVTIKNNVTEFAKNCRCGMDVYDESKNICVGRNTECEYNLQKAKQGQYKQVITIDTIPSMM